MEKLKSQQEGYSYSELNEIRSRSADAIKKIREEILSHNVNNNDDAIKNKQLRTPESASLNFSKYS